MHPDEGFFCETLKKSSLQNTYPLILRIDRKYVKAALLVYKSPYGLAPKYISDMIVPYEPPRTMRSSGRDLLEKPRVRNKCGRWPFSSMQQTTGTVSLKV